MFARCRSTNLLGDDEHLGYLLVGVGLGDELDDLLLAWGQHLRVKRLAGAGWAKILARERPHAVGREEWFAAHRGAAGLDEVAIEAP
jgi:hypothetical protein